MGERSQTPERGCVQRRRPPSARMTNHPPKPAKPSNRITKMTFTSKRRSSDRVGLAEETQLSGRVPVVVSPAGEGRLIERRTEEPGSESAHEKGPTRGPLSLGQLVRFLSR